MSRQEVRPFADKQIALVQNFASQAVIAIENARLLNDLRQRTTDLTESLEQQTATANVLRVISSSSTDIQPVLDTIVRTAGELCASEYAALFRLQDGHYHAAAWNNAAAEWAKYHSEHPIHVDRGSLVGRTALERSAIHIVDCLADPEYAMHEAARLGRQRSMLGVPLLHNGIPIGVIGLLRTVVKPFTEKQIELVTSFADQAVIAIENARLLSELRLRTADLSQRTGELTESLEQQTATSEVLQVINSTPGDLQAVFATMLKEAARICDAALGNIQSWDGESFRVVATYKAPPALVEARRHLPFRPSSPDAPLGRLVATKMVVHIDDLAAERSYIEDRHPAAVAAVEGGGVRTVLLVPMLKENEVIGAFTLSRQEVRPFTEKQIALVTNFAAQAVIAIENARLLHELRQRTTDLGKRTEELTESLEQQTATSEVLQVISRSTFDLQTVLDTLTKSAVRLCSADNGVIFQRDGDLYRFSANFGFSTEAMKYAQEHPLQPSRTSLTGRVALDGRVHHIPDVLADPEYRLTEYQEVFGYRTNLGVPLLRAGSTIGIFSLTRKEVNPFTDKQIELVKTFADQAVIAIENARLLHELRQSTSDLSKSLEQQIATSEVLQVISSSPGDLEPVFATMLENAVRICDANFGNIYRWDGEVLHLLASHNTPPALADARKHSPLRPYAETPVGRMVVHKAAFHLADMTVMPGYIDRSDPGAVAAVELGGVRTILAIPMLKENEMIGSFSVYRQEVRPFTDKQIALVTNFAAQAVIAIENTRLLSELRESLQEQTATSEMLQVISSSPGDLQPVFAAMLEKAVRICDATFGNIYRWDGDALQLVATHNTPPAYAEHRKHSPFRAEQNNSVAQMITGKKVVHLLDAAANETYATRRDPTVVAAVELGGIRSALIVPMLKEDDLVGAFIVSRQEVRPFTEKQIALVTNFAAQAVIAIENARLLMELRERTEEVEKLNQHLESRVADQVDEIERTGRLRRFLPPQVADLIVASGTEKQLESHRREITALFCDLRGFTGFSESADPEDVMALLREYHAAIGEIIVRYSGTLERYAGDGVMVVFNDPIPVDNPALQAVLMALEMRDAIGALTEKWRRLGHDIGFGIGIAHGFATLGTIGFEGKFDYAAIGTVSNVASRLCDEAKPGQILISPRVLMAVEDAVTVEPVGEFALKGIRRPIAAYNVVAALPPSP